MIEFKDKQLPWGMGDVVVDWDCDDGLDGVGLAIDLTRGVEVCQRMHPSVFCRLIFETYGADAAFSMLKVLMHDYIDELFKSKPYDHS